jgi:hypothetical protein
MKKILISAIACSLLSTYSAFAQNIGQLEQDRQPQKLRSAEEFVKYAAASVQNPAPHSAAPLTHGTTEARTQNHFDDCDDFGLGLGMGSLGLLGSWDMGLGWGLWPYVGSYFPYYSYYYPYYYGSYYSPYYYPYSSYYWAQPNDDQQPNTAARTQTETHQAVATDRAHTPVVCFASDTSGNWYANVDTAANAVKTQQAINHECAQSGLDCTQNVGCALATNTPTR